MEKHVLECGNYDFFFNVLIGALFHKFLTVEKLEIWHEEHICFVADTLEANLVDMRNCHEQLETTRTESQIGEKDMMDHGFHTTGLPLEIGSTSTIQISAANAYTQEIQKDEEAYDFELEDEQVEKIQSAPGVDLVLKETLNDIYTPLSDDCDLLLIDYGFHYDELFVCDKDKPMFNPPPHGKTCDWM